MKTECPNCKNEFEAEKRRYNASIKNGSKLYCSGLCYYKSKLTGFKENCKNCGKEITVTKSRKAKSKTGNLYCSKKCSTIVNNSLFRKWENNPLFKNGGTKYRVFKLRNTKDPKCEKCSNDDIRVLQVHHKDKNRKNNKIENLQLLCANCHLIEHSESGL